MGVPIVQTPPVPGVDTDGDGWLDELEAIVGTDHLRPDVPCASSSYSITESFKVPRADFVFIVDSSGSMREELPLIKSGLQSFFSPLLSNPQLDFRVIFIGSFDDTGGFCLNDEVNESFECSNDRPTKSENFLYYDRRVNSGDALEILLDSYQSVDPQQLVPQGWSSFLRDDARLAITVVTDDNAWTEHKQFATRFRLLDQNLAHHNSDGTPDYIFHSIIGINDAPGGQAWPPSSSVQNSACFSAPNSGQEYQGLSILTGGLRFSICRSADYGTMLEQSARTVFDDGYIPCVFPLPDSENRDEQAGSEQLSLQLERASSTDLLGRVSSSAQCDQGDFYVRRTGFGGSAVYLCPEVCQAIQQSTQITLRAATSCTSTACPAKTPTHTGQCTGL